jgi:hypothetical protein
VSQPVIKLNKLVVPDVPSFYFTNIILAHRDVFLQKSQ